MVGIHFKMELLKFKKFEPNSSFGLDYKFEEVNPSGKNSRRNGMVSLGKNELWLYDSLEEAIDYIKKEAKKEFKEKYNKLETEYVNNKLGELISDLDISKIKKLV